MDLKKDAEGGVDREENERVDTAKVRRNERRLVTVTRQKMMLFGHLMRADGLEKMMMA